MGKYRDQQAEKMRKLFGITIVADVKKFTKDLKINKKCINCDTRCLVASSATKYYNGNILVSAYVYFKCSSCANSSYIQSVDVPENYKLSF